MVVKRSVAAVIQARMGSTRLPGKILKQLNGKPLLLFIIDRLKKMENLDEIIAATTEKKEDDITQKFLEENRIKFFRGSDDNVLERYYKVSLNFELDIIIRITADNPFIDPEILTKGVKMFMDMNEKERNCDYLRTLKFPVGTNIEIFDSLTLNTVYKEAVSDYDKEHVTSYIYTHPEKFKIHEWVSDKDYSSYRLTVDTEEDFSFAVKVLQNLQPENNEFNLNDIINIIPRL